MKIIRMSDITGELNRKGFLMKTLIEHKNTTVKNIILKSGEVIPPHAVGVDVFFYVVKGNGTIVIGGVDNLVKAEDIVVCPVNTPMSVKANQGEEFSFLNVKTPSL